MCTHVYVWVFVTCLSLSPNIFLTWLDVQLQFDLQEWGKLSLSDLRNNDYKDRHGSTCKALCHITNIYLSCCPVQSQSGFFFPLPATRSICKPISRPSHATVKLNIFYHLLFSRHTSVIIISCGRYGTDIFSSVFSIGLGWKSHSSQLQTYNRVGWGQQTSAIVDLPDILGMGEEEQE